MRADRLLATVLLLQAHGSVTAAEVAAEHEISLATARRDLSALSAAGVPVYSQAGRGGGWSLVGGARTDLSGLTYDEARALFLVAGPAAAAGAPLQSALRKLVQALPQTFRADALAAAEAMTVDPIGWGGRGRTRPAMLDALQDAVVRRRRIELDYRDRTQRPTRRLVDPWGLVDKDDLWYLVAGTPGGQRTFRVDRITRLTITDSPADRPVDLDLDRVWARIVGEVEQRRSGLTATVLIDPTLVPVLRAHFGRHCESLGMTDDDRTRVRVAGPFARSIAEQLAGWGAAVEVVEPAEVRIELARLGAELVARYGPAPPHTPH